MKYAENGDKINTCSIFLLHKQSSVWIFTCMQARGYVKYSAFGLEMDSICDYTDQCNVCVHAAISHERVTHYACFSLARLSSIINQMVGKSMGWLGEPSQAPAPLSYSQISHSVYHCYLTFSSKSLRQIARPEHVNVMGCEHVIACVGGQLLAILSEDRICGTPKLKRPSKLCTKVCRWTILSIVNHTRYAKKQLLSTVGSITVASNGFHENKQQTAITQIAIQP